MRAGMTAYRAGVCTIGLSLEGGSYVLGLSSGWFTIPYFSNAVLEIAR